jgi:CheY-like chemotaxis protein
MDDETRARMFEPFFTTKFIGRGLGLAAAQGVVRGHGGTLEVESAPGRGATVTALFPFRVTETETPAVAPRPDAGWRGSGTVLLVDDDELVRAVGQRMLERLGFQVLLADSGSLAVTLFQEHAAEIVCVLLDLTMPHVDGEDTFNALRAIREDVCVILSSGYAEQDVVSRFTGQGLAGFVQKPYSVESLARTLRSVLDR